MPKYSGFWTPEMGEGETPQQPKRVSLPASRFTSPQIDAYREREEQRAKLEAWMRGYEPREEWQAWTNCDPPIDHVLIMSFPKTTHYVGVYEDPIEHGRLVMWCFGCMVNDCGACKWARRVYVSKIKLLRFDKANEALPF